MNARRENEVAIEKMFTGPKLRRSLSSHSRHQGQERRPAGGIGVSARKLAANLWEAQDFGHVELRKVGEEGMRQREEERSFRFGKLCRPDASHEQVIAYAPSVTTGTSLDLNEMIEESESSHKTSMDLMKVLKRIWSLEEQQESDFSLIKELRSELEHSQARIKRLIKEQLEDHQLMDELLCKNAEEKSVWKSKECKITKMAVKPVKDELESEKKSRRHLDTSYPTLIEEFSVIKSCYAKNLEELERERKMRIVLQDLCDELAGGIKLLERELQEPTYKSGRKFDLSSHLFVLHLSETWLDKRFQMKDAEDNDNSGKANGLLAQLLCEVESHLQNRKTANLYDSLLDRTEMTANNESHISHQLNGTSVPKQAEEESWTDLHSYEPMSDDGVVSCSNDKSEMIDAPKRSNLVREKIGYFENITNDNSSGGEKLVNRQLMQLFPKPTQFFFQGRNNCPGEVIE